MRFVLSLLLTLFTLPILAQEPKEIPLKGRGYVPLSPEDSRKLHAQAFRRHGNKMAIVARNATFPAKFDCVELGWVPPVRDQGNCGSCYEVSTADQVTCAFIKGGYGKADDTFKISDQFGLDCHNFGGCNGGNGTEVIAWMCKNGFPAERYVDENGVSKSDYPGYTAGPGVCKLKQGAKLWKPADWGFAAGNQGSIATVDEIKAALMHYGVLNIAFDANAAYGNAGKNPVRITGKNINHETTLVGWDDEKKAFKTRGNWGKGLGDEGYVWFTYDSYIVDVFWVSVTPIVPPDPPVPPVPPGPGPGPTPGPTPGVQIHGQFNADGTITWTWSNPAPGDAELAQFLADAKVAMALSLDPAQKQAAAEAFDKVKAQALKFVADVNAGTRTLKVGVDFQKLLADVVKLFADIASGNFAAIIGDVLAIIADLGAKSVVEKPKPLPPPMEMPRSMPVGLAPEGGCQRRRDFALAW